MIRLALASCIASMLLASASALRAGTLVQFRTILGNIDVELLDQDKPATVTNFLRYISSGAYATNNMFFHRCVPGFVVQGGGYGVARRDLSSNFAVYRTVPHFAAVTNEFAVGRKVSNTYGTIAMAKVGGQPNSATSEWFFNLANNSTDLDTQNGGFTVFGTVVRGSAVLDLFNTPDTFGQVLDLRKFYGTAAATFSTLPVTYSGATIPHYTDLVYVDITTLNVRVSRTATGRDIRWTSVKDRPNVVEYTDVFPPVWQTLSRFTGDGSDQKVTDGDASARNRFYRVRIEY